MLSVKEKQNNLIYSFKLKFVFCLDTLNRVLSNSVIVTIFIVNSDIAIPLTPNPNENFGTRHINNIVVGFNTHPVKNIKY
jgi:hypothetical protein